MAYEEEREPSRKGKLIRSKADAVWLIILIVFGLSIGLIFMSNTANKHNVKHENTYTLTASDKKNIESTVNDFITRAGTFGLDWDNVKDDGSAFDIRNSWFVLIGGGSMDDVEDTDDLALLTRRSTIMQNLSQGYDGKASLIDPESQLAQQSDKDLAVTSDPMWLSGFKVIDNSVGVNFKGARTEAYPNGRNMATVKVSWSENWKRATNIPELRQTSTHYAPLSDYKLAEDRLTFKNVYVTLTMAADGKTWQVTKIQSDDNGYYRNHSYALATTGNVKYEANGDKD